MLLLTESVITHGPFDKFSPYTSRGRCDSVVATPNACHVEACGFVPQSAIQVSNKQYVLHTNTGLKRMPLVLLPLWFYFMMSFTGGGIGICGRLYSYLVITSLLRTVSN